MAASTDNLPGPLIYQTWTLKVPIHCEGCKKKVKKILQRLEGVYMTTIDAQQHKVTVTGSIDAQTLLHKLSKSGKPAELWPDNSVKKNENVVEAPNSAKEKIKPAKESDGKSKNQKEQGKVTEEVGQKKSADNQANPVKGGEVSDKAALPLDDGDKPLQLQNAGGADEVDGKSNGNNADKKKKKKKKKSKGNNNGNAGNDEKSKTPPTPSTSPPVVPETAPVTPPLTPALAPTSMPVESPVPVETQAPAPTKAKASVPIPAPAPAPTDGFSGHSIECPENPIGPMNFGPSNSYGPPNQGYPNGPYQIPSNFIPQNEQNYMYPPPHAHYPQPQLGMSYSMAQPSSSTSYYAPPYYAYEYPQYHTMHIPPPPSNPINELYHDDQYYNDDADASRCRLM